MKTTRFDRQTFIRGSAAGGAAWLLPSLRGSYARAATGIPRRLVIFYTNHGTLPQFWATGPGGSGKPTQSNWDFGDILQPVARFKQDLLLLSGVDMKSRDVAGEVGGDAHMIVQCHSMTSAKQVSQEMAGGISIDQYVVNALKASNGGNPATALPSVMLSIADRGPGPFPWGHPFYYGPSQPVPLERVPGNAYQRMFPNGPPTGGAPKEDPRMVARKSMADRALSEFEHVANRLGRAEKTKLDAHAAALRDLEKRLALTPGRACEPPAASNFSRGGNYWNTGYDQHPRLAHLALACDLTRVVAIHVDEVPDGISGYRGGMLGTQNSHDLIHQTDRNNGSLRSDAQGIAVVKKYHLVYAQLFANFLDLLKNTPESDGGSLLDHTAVLWCGEISEGGHGTNNLRWMIAGNCQGAFKTGRLLIWDDYDRSEFRSSAVAPSHADLFVSLANAMGVDTDTFGIAGACKGPIASLAG